MSSEIAYFTDVHVHLQDPAFQRDVDAVLRKARRSGVKRFFCNGTGPDDWPRVRELAKNHAEVIPCFGLHPWFIDKVVTSDTETGRSEDSQDSQNFNGFESWTQTLLAFLKDGSSACSRRPGVGEIGLDHARPNRDGTLQEFVFRKQVRIAAEEHLPLMLHTVRALRRVIEILGEHDPSLPVLFHSFSGSREQVETLFGISGRKRKAAFENAYCSFSATLLRDQNRRVKEAALAVPEDRILIESDAPALSPSRATTRNEPDVLPEICRALAAIRGVSERSMRNILFENTERFLEMWPKAKP